MKQPEPRVMNATPRVVPYSEMSHEVRELRFRIKMLGRQNGQQGDTIHRLRAELAEVRELNSKVERGLVKSLERQVVEYRRLLDQRNDDVGVTQGDGVVAGTRPAAVAHPV